MADDETSSKPKAGDDEGASTDTSKTEGESGGLFKDDDDDEDGGDKKENASAEGGKKRFGFLKKKKFWLIGGGALTTALFFILMILILLSALKLPDFVNDMTDYEWARLTRNVATSEDTMALEKLAIDASSDEAYSAIPSKFSRATAMIKAVKELNVGAMIANARSQAVAKSLQDIGLKYTTEKGGLGRAVLTTLTIDGTDYQLKRGGALTKVIPKLQFVRNVSFSSKVAPALNDALQANNWGFDIRTADAKLLREAIGVDLNEWLIGKGISAATSDKSADNALAQDVAKNVTNGDQPVSSSTGVLNSTTQQANQELQSEINGPPSGVADAVVNGGYSTKLKNIIKKGIAGTFSGVIPKIINPLSSVMMLVCIVADDSQPSTVQQTVDAQDTNVQRIGYGVSSAAAQLETSDGDATAAGAWTRKIDGTAGGAVGSKTNVVYQRANGQTYDTRKDLQPQASPSGQLNIFTALWSGDAGQFMSRMVSDACPTVTSPEFNIALGLGTVATCFVPGLGETDCLGSQAVKQGAETMSGRILGAITTRIATEKAGNVATALGGFLQDGITNLVKVGTTVAVLTYTAKAIVTAKSLASTSGLQQGPEFADDADDGMNQAAGEESRQLYGGRPLTSQELAQSQNADLSNLNALNQSQSFYDRYFSFSNPMSLMSKLAIDVNENFTDSFFRNFASLSTKVLSPIASLGEVFSIWQHNKVYAAAGSVDLDSNYYGNVQWGFSEAEDNLVASDPTYGPIENEDILERSGQADAIQAKFDTCLKSSIGTLKSQGLIVQDEPTGDVVANQGLCSPDNLSYDSTDPLAYDGSPSTNKRNDLIFRWRVEISYNEDGKNMAAQGKGPSNN